MCKFMLVVLFDIYQLQASKLRFLVSDSEKRSEESREQLNDILVQREQMQHKIDHFVNENTR